MNTRVRRTMSCSTAFTAIHAHTSRSVSEPPVRCSSPCATSSSVRAVVTGKTRIRSFLNKIATLSYTCGPFQPLRTAAPYKHMAERKRRGWRVHEPALSENRRSQVDWGSGLVAPRRILGARVLHSPLQNGTHCQNFSNYSHEL